jgi:hypothetical protein
MLFQVQALERSLEWPLCARLVHFVVAEPMLGTLSACLLDVLVFRQVFAYRSFLKLNTAALPSMPLG